MWSDVLVAATVALLGSWFGLTCISALPGGRRLWGRSLLIPKLVPTWSFFAPVPGTHDFRLLYRDELAGGTVTPWREVNPYSERRATAALWNPGQRRKKALFDLAQELTGVGSSWRSDPQLVKLSVPYLALLTFVSSLERSALSRRRQFVVALTSRRDEPQVIFVSGMHDLELQEDARPSVGGAVRVAARH